MRIRLHLFGDWRLIRQNHLQQQSANRFCSRRAALQKRDSRE